MVKIKSYQIVAFALATLMFCTSVGFTIDMHFCQGNLAAVSVFGEATCCKNACVANKKACCQLPVENGTKGCCENTSIDVQLDTDIPQVETPTLSKSQIQFVVAFVTTYFPQYNPTTSIVKYQNYKPPLLIRDIPVLIQSFLC